MLVLKKDTSDDQDKDQDTTSSQNAAGGSDPQQDPQSFVDTSAPVTETAQPSSDGPRVAASSDADADADIQRRGALKRSHSGHRSVKREGKLCTN